ncbi:MAG: hypothetical protein HYY76_11195 [Acidobacteria bacterium]|nr:hypothetical protein [Acidobacteriota bacterium]
MVEPSGILLEKKADLKTRLYDPFQIRLTPLADDGIVVVTRSGASEVSMETLLVPPPVRDKLGDAGSDGLVNMFAEAHRIGVELLDRRFAESNERLDRRMGEISASFERRLGEETSKLRLEMASLKFEILKWNFLFWIGQLAAMTAILSVMLRGVR